MGANTIIRFDNVRKLYDGDDAVVLDNVSFEIEHGKFYTLLGPSGCGKTTILRLIAGFIEPTEGSIYMHGKRINSVPPNKRQVNTVFQDYALFPHLNVYENVAFGLRVKKLKNAGDFGRREPPDGRAAARDDRSSGSFCDVERARCKPSSRAWRNANACPVAP